MKQAAIAAVALAATVGAWSVAVERAAAQPSGSARELTLKALIQSKNDITISAEAAGVITELPVSEGTQVAPNDLLATIDDRQAKAAVDVAQYGFDAAKVRADDDIEERFAAAAAAVAYQDWQMDLAAKRFVANAVAEISIRKKKLDFERYELQIEKAKHDRVIAEKDAAVKEAELRAAEVELARRRIDAPFAGEVQEVLSHQAEWVNPGDAILRLVQFDLLYADALVDAAKYDPADVAGRAVTVKVTTAGGEKTIDGKLVFVSQSLLEATQSGSYLVRALVENRQENGFWLIRPGLPAEMTVHLDRAGE